MSNHPEILHLIGDPQENFYILGKKDKKAFSSLEKLLSPFKFRSNNSGIDGFFKEILHSYAEGLESTEERVLDVISNLELIGTQALLPSHFPVIPRSRTYLTWNKEYSSTEITTSLYSPMLGQGLFKPTMLYFNFTNYKKVLVPSWEGMSLMFFSSTNHMGLHLSLHHQFGELLEEEAELITPQLFNLIFNAQDLNSVKKTFKNFKSQRFWGLTAALPDGSVLHLDHYGAQNYFEKLNLIECQHLLFDEAPLKDQENNYLEPALVNTFQKMAQKNLHQYSEFNPHLFSHFIKINLNNFETLTTSKDLNQNKLYSFKDPFQQPKQIQEKKLNFPLPITQAQEHLSKAQYFFSHSLWEDAFHHIQMSLAHDPQPDVELIFHFWEFLRIENKKEWGYIYQKVRNLKTKLPEHLQDLAKFLLILIELRLGLKKSIDMASFTFDIYPKIYSKIEQAEANHHKLILELMPRLDFSDLIVPSFLYK